MLFTNEIVLPPKDAEVKHGTSEINSDIEHC